MCLWIRCHVLTHLLLLNRVSHSDTSINIKLDVTFQHVLLLDQLSHYDIYVIIGSMSRFDMSIIAELDVIFWNMRAWIWIP